MSEIGAFGVEHVCVTGGEPLAQKNSRRALEFLCAAGYRVSLETSGAFDIEHLDPRVQRVMDLKTPGSGEHARNRWENLAHLRDGDVVKFVICDRADYDWSSDVVRRHDLAARCLVLFSPSWSQLPAAELADWILADRLQVRLQIQLHKILWGDTPGR
jgi:7-carboxy-7-deazaguanine synthase